MVGILRNFGSTRNKGAEAELLQTAHKHCGRADFRRTFASAIALRPDSVIKSRMACLFRLREVGPVAAEVM